MLSLILVDVAQFCTEHAQKFNPECCVWRQTPSAKDNRAPWPADAHEARACAREERECVEYDDICAIY